MAGRAKGTTKGRKADGRARITPLVAGGTLSDLETIFASHSGSLYQRALKLLGNHEDAEDALQEALLAACKNLGCFEGRSKLSTWLTRIVINAALMTWRRRSVRRTVSIDERWGETELALAKQLRNSTPGPEELCARAQLRRMLDQKLAELSPEKRSALVLCDLEGLSLREAAQTLGVPESTLKTRLHRGRLEVAKRITAEVSSTFSNPTNAERQKCASPAPRIGHAALNGPDDAMAQSPDGSAGAAAQQHNGNGLEQDLPVKGG